MVRNKSAATLLAVCVVGSALSAWGFAQGGRESPGTAPLTPVKKQGTARKTTFSVQEKLARPISIPRGIDPNTPLQDALELLGEQTELSFRIDAVSFRRQGFQGEFGHLPVSLPKMTDTPARVILGCLLEQLEQHTTYLIRDRMVIITHAVRISPAAWKSGLDIAPRVDIRFQRTPLAQALRDVAEATGINVVVDPQINEKAKVEITASFTQTPVDEVVFLVAEMADLVMVPTMSTLYVTTRPNFEVLKSQELRDGSGRYFFDGPGRFSMDGME